MNLKEINKAERTRQQKLKKSSDREAFEIEAQMKKSGLVSTEKSTEKGKK